MGLGDTIGQQSADPLTDRASFEGIEHDRIAVAVGATLDEDFVKSWNMAPAFLQLHQFRERLERWTDGLPGGDLVDQSPDTFGQFTRKGHIPTEPSGDRSRIALGLANPNGSFADPFHFEQFATEKKLVPFFELRSERFFDKSDFAAGHVLDLNHHIRGDRTDGHAMTSSDGHIAHRVLSKLQCDAMKVLVGMQAAAGGYKVQDPIEVFVWEVPISPGRADLVEEL